MQADRQLRIGIILPNLWIGGAQEVARVLAQQLASDRCVPVVCALFDGGPLMQDLIQQGTQVEVLYLRRHRFLAFPRWLADMIHMWRTLSHFIIQHQINVIQTNVLGSENFLVLALAHVMALPVITFNFHSQKFLSDTKERSVRNLLYRLAYRLARRWVSDYVAVSTETKATMVHQLGLAETQITVIGNGVEMKRYQQAVDRDDVRRQLGLEPEAKVLITVGTLRTAKGHRYLIEAAGNVIKQHPDVHLLFVGDGELRQELESQVIQSGFVDKIHFLGDRRDVTELLAASDVFVMPSLWEGLSMALLEAMAAAKPIVATAVSGTSQVLTHNETGILVPPGDATALAQAISNLLSQSEVETKAMGEAARRSVAARFSGEKQAKEYLALYDRLLGYAKSSGRPSPLVATGE